jgi:hypothetical protein
MVMNYMMKEVKVTRYKGFQHHVLGGTELNYSTIGPNS